MEIAPQYWEIHCRGNLPSFMGVIGIFPEVVITDKMELEVEGLLKMWIWIAERNDGEDEGWMWDSTPALHTICVSVLQNKFKCQLISF